ncbi:MAG: Xaa-Pro peptidase family protein [Candidatus Obscuribacterales bacterium]|nr:Xaa-Pro peptidase family protein [Candidatus Obscuribacterales bacterium]
MKERLPRLRKAMAKEKLAGLLVRVAESGQSTQPNNQNVLYLSGFGGSAAVLLVTRKQAFIITDARYYTRVRQEAVDFQLVNMNLGESIDTCINRALKLAKLNKRSKVGFESHRLPHDMALSWIEKVNVNLVPTTHLVERLRQYKDEDELKLLARACRATCKVYDEVVALIKPGMKEVDVAFEIDTRLRKHGASDNSFSSIVASGPNSAIPHHATGKRRLKAGEPVVMDFGGVFDGGYCSDITRTVFVPGKKPTAAMQEIYEVVLGANKRARRVLRAGVSYAEYDKAARDYIQKLGYGKYFTHGLGHSLGLETHDPYDYANDPFEVGAVVTDEPGIYIEGVGGVRIEDDLIVTETGARRLTSAPYWSF